MPWIDSWVWFSSSILGAFAGTIGTVVALRRCHNDNWKMIQYYWDTDIREIKRMIKERQE